PALSQGTGGGGSRRALPRRVASHRSEPCLADRSLVRQRLRARAGDVRRLMPSTILITGASTGFGRDAAERLARRGHRVYATMRDVGNRNAAHRAALAKIARDEDLDLQVL